MIIALKEPFISNRGSLSQVSQQVLRLEWQGLVGFGTSLAADPAELAKCVPVLARTDTPYAFRSVLAQLAETGIRTAVLAAVDLALHDLVGKAVGRPIRDLFGLAGLPIAPTGLSIGACPDAELARRGRKFSDWPILKLKMTPEDDGHRVGVLRSVYSGRIWVDGNGSWTPQRAVEVARTLSRYDVELFEQPVPRGADIGYVHERSAIPVLADEDCAGPADVLRLAGRVDGINVKLTKCGGLSAAWDMITLARGTGLRVMLGCKNESSLGVTAMAQLAGAADYLDLDGHLNLLADPFTGAHVQSGTITVPDNPGLGVTTGLPVEEG